MKADPGRLVTANISRDEVALWVFEGFHQKRVPAHLTTEQAIADLKAAGRFRNYQLVADRILEGLSEKFAPGLPS